MKRYTKILKTKREIAELMIRPISKNLPEEFEQRIIEKIMMLESGKFINNARNATKLDIIPFFNNTYMLRYIEDMELAEELPIDYIIKQLLKLKP